MTKVQKTRVQNSLVTRSAGQLGQSAKKIAADYLDYDFVFANFQQPDLSNETSVEKNFKHQTIDIISNCAILTAVDKAELDRELANIQCLIWPIETKDSQMSAQRLDYSVSNKIIIKDTYDLAVPYWKDSLKQCVIELQEKASW